MSKILQIKTTYEVINPNKKNKSKKSKSQNKKIEFCYSLISFYFRFRANKENSKDVSDKEIIKKFLKQKI